jgi:hypothetical protein
VAVPPPVAGQLPTTTGPHLRNDAHLANWTDDFIRVMKDAWVKLNQLLGVIEDRLLALEQRIADTYTYGQKGALTLAVDGPLTFLALPLRVVRDEELVELVATCETAATDTSTVLAVQHGTGGVFQTVRTLTLNTGATLVEFKLPTPRKMLRNDVLRVVINAVSLDGKDFVVQVRCR